MPKNNNQDKIILDLCGGTGAWSKPYKDDGYDVRLITLPDHDVRLYIPPDNVYGVLSAPPCTHLASSGARWWAAKGESALLDALSTVDACLRIVKVPSEAFDPCVLRRYKIWTCWICIPSNQLDIYWADC